MVTAKLHSVVLPTRLSRFMSPQFEKRSEEPMDVDGDSGRAAKKKLTTLEEAAKVADNKGRTPLLRCIITNSKVSFRFLSRYIDWLG